MYPFIIRLQQKVVLQAHSNDHNCFLITNNPTLMQTHYTSGFLDDEVPASECEAPNTLDSEKLLFLVTDCQQFLVYRQRPLTDNSHFVPVIVREFVQSLASKKIFDIVLACG